MNFRSADDSDNDDTSVQSRSPIPSLPRTHTNNNNNINISNNNNPQNNNNNYFSGSGSYYSSNSSMAGTAVSHLQYQTQQNNRSATSNNSIFGNLLANIPNSWSILELLNLGGTTNNTLGGIVLTSSSASTTTSTSGTSSKSPTTTTTTSNNNVKKLTPTTTATATTTTTSTSAQQQQQQPSKASLEVSIVVRHFTGDFRQFTVPHADFSIREIKETYIATLDKMPQKDLQEFLTHTQTQIEHFKRRRHYFTASPNNVLNTRNNSAVVNNNSFSGMSYTGNNFQSASENNNNYYSNRTNSGGNQFFSPPSSANPNAAGAGGGSTRHSGFLGKSFSNIKININDINFASRDGHILQDFEKISSLKKMDSVQSYLELYVVPLLLHKREEPLLVVSPLFPLPTSSSTNSSASNNNNVLLPSSSPQTLDQNNSTCGGNPIIIREYDFSNAILQVNINTNQQQEQTHENNNNNNNVENGAAGSTPRKTQSQNINEVKFATTTLSQMNSSNSLLSQEQKTQSNSSVSPKSETTPSNNNTNNNNINIHAENSNITPTTTQNQNVSPNNNNNINSTLRELTIREVAISPADLARKRASGLGNDTENNNNQNKSVDCGDLIVHVHPASHVLVIEHNNINSSSSSPSSSTSSPRNPNNNNNLHQQQQQQQQSLQVKCVDHFCKFISVHNNINVSNNNNNKSGQKFTAVTTPSKMSSPNRGNNNINVSSSKPPLSNTSAGHNASSPTSVAGASVGVGGGLPPLASNNNNIQQQQAQSHEQNNMNSFHSQNQIFAVDRSLQYFSSQHWSPVHAWVSPDGNFVIVHIVEKEESSTSTSFSGLPLHINNPFAGGISSTSHPHHSHTHNQSQSNHKTENTNTKVNGTTNNSSTVFLVFESAARGSSWLCRGAFRMPFEDITISGWACENRFVLCVGLTHCVVRVEVEGEISIQCSTLVKETLTKSSNNNHEHDASGNPSSSNFVPSAHSLPNAHNIPSTSSRFAPPLQIVRTLHTYMDGTLMWYDSKRALLKICHPAASLAAAMKLLEQNIQHQQGGIVATPLGVSSSLLHHSISGSSLVKDDQHQQHHHLSSSPSASSVHGGPTMSKLSSSTVNTNATSSVASTISSNPLIQTMGNHLSNVGFAIHFKRRVNHAQAQNYNFLLQSRPPHWQQHHQQLLSSSLPRLVLSPGEDGRFQGFCSVSNESNIIGNNNNNNNSSSSSALPALPIPLSTTKATPQAIYFLHKLNLIETAPDLPNEAFIAMFPKYLIYVSEHPIVPTFAMGGNNSSSPTANNNNNNNSISTSSNNNNNVMREDRFVISYVYPPIVPGNVVCCQYAKPTTVTGFARLRVVYCHDDETTGETTLHVVVLQAEWKDVKNVNNPLNFVHITTSGSGDGNSSSNNNNSNNSNAKKSETGATAVANSNNNTSGGGLFDYLKKKISVWRGNSDDVLAANASKEAERIALATHKQIKFTSGGNGAGDDASSSSSSLSAFKHGACDCFMAAAAPVGLIVKATGSGGGIAVVRVRAGLYGS